MDEEIKPREDGVSCLSSSLVKEATNRGKWFLCTLNTETLVGRNPSAEGQGMIKIKAELL